MTFNVYVSCPGGKWSLHGVYSCIASANEEIRYLVGVCKLRAAVMYRKG